MLTHGIRILAPCALIVVLDGVGAGTDSTAVQNGIELQQAIDRAQPGETILLSPGVVYTGNFVLPARTGRRFITIRTAETAGQPPSGVRVQPRHAAVLAKIQSPNGQPALQTAPGARFWRLELLEFGPNQLGRGDIITLGDGSSAQRERSQVPEHLVIDRCYIHGDPAVGQKRGIALNSGATSILNSYISDMKLKGLDAQAIAGWNGPGPYVIQNNYLEASGNNVLFGGADPSIHGLVTSDVVVRRNHMSKPLEWRDQGWSAKNLFELKNARRVLLEGNILEHSWMNAQLGYAILLTPRNQDGGAPWATVEDVTIRYNVVRHVGGGMQIIGEDSNNRSESTRRVVVTQNLFYDIDSDTWGGTGAFALVGEGPSDITIQHNTIQQNGKILATYGGTKDAPRQVHGFRFTENLIRHNEYGVHGDDRATGNDTLRAFYPGAVFQNNGIAGGEPARYPAGNTFIPEGEFDAQFVNPREGDFRLRPDSRFRRGSSVRRDLGADIAALSTALGLRPRLEPRQ